MFPSVRLSLRLPQRFPRASGDVPPALGKRMSFETFSPRERGCSRKREGLGVVVLVFPARAG